MDQQVILMLDMKENESNSIPDLIEDDKEPVYIPMTSVVYAEHTKILTPDMVYTQVFQVTDDVLRCEKITGEIVSLQQILRGPLKPTIVQMERWAAGDGNASEAFNKHKANELWEAHARNPQVAIYRRNIMLRRVGLYHSHEDDDDDISQCTDFLT